MVGGTSPSGGIPGCFDGGGADIARVAGLHRATVHRHFPTREDLVAAVRARWYVEAERAVEEARPEVGPPELALPSLSA